MDDEKLIEYIREYEELYDLSHSQYLNGNIKNKKWAEISNKLKQPVAACKSRWNNIRDNFRKSLKKRGAKSGQAGATNKRYKYESQLSFLVPFIKERETSSSLSNVERTTGDENDNSDNDENDDIEEDDLDQAIISKSEIVETIDDMEHANENIDSDVKSSKLTSSLQFKRKRARGTKSIFKNPSATVSATLLRYVLEQKEKTNRQPVHPVDAFLAGIAPTLKALSPYHLNIAKSKIFNTLQEIELEQIMHM
ncbi:uncharacterized protein LOC105699324 [Orussus abietinus]|uniref:uncharacterized protein LOC105699324 n=1 Tax=Orussus abietinus TaxID=222816 RepID=UPI0006251738|nr:uncharacterized protein LOC105699324 [Orussus abietinus]